MTTPSEGAPSGLFISHLTDDIFGHGWRTVVSQTPAPDDPARRWVHPNLLDPQVVTGIRHQFLSDPQVLHVCLSDALQPALAAQIYADLQAATFVRHHHTHYPLWIAPRDKQQPSIFTHFVDWLGTREAAAYHAWLVRWPHPLSREPAIQVQTSRMGVGDQFPAHIDSNAEGIAVVYNFTTIWQPSWGGVLEFPSDQEGQSGLRVPPIFNSVIVFRPQDAPHRVTEVQPESQGWHRYTITVFYLQSHEHEGHED